MHDEVLRRMRHLLRRGLYSLTDHADWKLQALALSMLDLEQVILCGFITDRQKDTASNEWKYVLEGPTSLAEHAVVVAKISRHGTLIVLTVFRL